ncbi:hypothetical protein KSD_69670 [Ktedonobacter sp. SOSP1-85]|uniref:DUF4158 domain-containing protein n=1 Tax=Ktedonobacter sp. SOSP1-85 TaxID=2778367 RepID=UPI0019162ED1|nr:hypothetical protein KSD_69670 [Ktedonobacter sp. SOSP1-85]
MPGYDKIPTYLTPEQRHTLTHIPQDPSDREIARYYTFTEKELELINYRRRGSNRLGFAVQLALLKFPGRTGSMGTGREQMRTPAPSLASHVGQLASFPVSLTPAPSTCHTHQAEGV